MLNMPILPRFPLIKLVHANYVLYQRTLFPFSDRAINSYAKHGQKPVEAAQNIVSCKCTFSLPIIYLPPAKETPVPSVRVTTHKRHATCVPGLYMHWLEVH